MEIDRIVTLLDLEEFGGVTDAHTVARIMDEVLPEIMVVQSEMDSRMHEVFAHAVPGFFMHRIEIRANPPDDVRLHEIVSEPVLGLLNRVSVPRYVKKKHPIHAERRAKVKAGRKADRIRRHNRRRR